MTDPIDGAGRGTPWWGLGATLAIATIALLRACATFDPFPYWSLDPLQSVTPQTGLSPVWALMLDAMTLACAGIALLGEAAAGRRVHAWMFVLYALGAVGIGAHAWVLRGPSIDDLLTGSAWAASLAGALAMVHAARDPRTARIVAAACLGLVVLLAGKGALQYFLEHAQTLDEFRRNRDAFLASQGMTPGSVAARTFERRLSQPEATGWFGLSNVFASLAAGLGIALLGLTLLARRRVHDPLDRPSEGWTLVLALAACAGLGGVWLSGSKGGLVVTALGVGLIGALAFARGIVRRSPSRSPSSSRARLAGGVIATSLVVLVLLAVVARGVVGERLGELSLWFRWFYMVGAVRIALSHWLWGVGPAGFKEAYMLAKPALSPEEVTSPHSVLLDWWATLGVFGLAWGVLWARWVWGLGRTIASGVIGADEARHAAPASPSSLASGPARMEARLVAIIASIALIISTRLEIVALAPEGAIFRVLGLFGWIGVSLAALALMRTRVGAFAWRAPMALGALMVCLHSQIEVTSIWCNAAPLAMLMVGLGAAPAAGVEREARRSRSVAIVCGMCLIAMASVVAWRGVVPVMRWERGLREASRAVEPLASIRQRLSVIAAAGASARAEDSMGKIATDLGALLNEYPAQSQSEFDRAMGALTARVALEASAHLAAASEVFPSHVPTLEALVRVRLARAAALLAVGDRPGSISECERAWKGADAGPRTSSGLLLRGNTLASRSEIERDPRFLEDALSVWEQAAALDPFGSSVPWRAFVAAQALGHKELAARWARACLQGETNQRLDPLRRLTDEQRRQIEGVLGRGP